MARTSCGATRGSCARRSPPRSTHPRCASCLTWGAREQSSEQNGRGGHGGAGGAGGRHAAGGARGQRGGRGGAEAHSSVNRVPVRLVDAAPCRERLHAHVRGHCRDLSGDAGSRPALRRAARSARGWATMGRKGFQGGGGGGEEEEREEPEEERGKIEVERGEAEEERGWAEEQREGPVGRGAHSGEVRGGEVRGRAPVQRVRPRPDRRPPVSLRTRRVSAAADATRTKIAQPSRPQPHRGRARGGGRREEQTASGSKVMLAGELATNSRPSAALSCERAHGQICIRFAQGGGERSASALYGGERESEIRVRFVRSAPRRRGGGPRA